MLRRRNVLFLCAVLLVMALVAVSCQPSAPTPAPTPKPPAQSTTAPAPVPAPTTPAAAVIKTGGTIHVAGAASPSGFDPHRKPTGYSFFTPHIFSSLVRVKPGATTIILSDIVPNLAQSWAFSPDGKTVTFKLVNNAKWHDGMPFTSADVVYSFEKMKDPARSLIMGTLTDIDRFEAPDAYTFVLYLKNPSPSLLPMLSGIYHVMEPKHLSAADFKTTDFLVGTGPFKYKSYTSGVSLQMERNPNYFKKDASGRQLPYLDGIDYQFMPDKNAQAAAIISGRLDAAQLGGTGFENVDQYNRVKDQVKGWVTVLLDSWNHPYFLFNGIDGAAPLKNIKVRQALCLLIDQEALGVAAYGTKEWGVYNLDLVLNGYGNTADAMAKIYGYDLPMAQRVAKAKQLMAEAGYPNGGFKLKFLSYSYQQILSMATYTSAIWKKELNVDTEIVPLSPGEAYPATQKRQFDVAIGGLGGSAGLPDELKPQIMTGGQGNFLGYSNPEVDRLMTAQSSEMDPVKRTQMVSQALSIFHSSFLEAASNGGKSVMGWWPYVKGVDLTPELGNVTLETAWLDK
jgi:peptide/nickel transport system substrate-binding protein